MKKSTTKSRYLRPLAITAFWMVLLGSVLAGIQWYETNVVAPERKAAAEAIAKLPNYQRLDMKVICLNGVEYWVKNPFRHTGQSMAPKYSPGQSSPDVCEML